MIIDSKYNRSKRCHGPGGKQALWDSSIGNLPLERQIADGEICYCYLFSVKEGQLAIYVNGSDLRRLHQSFPRPFENHYAGANSFPRHLSELYACGRLPINRYHQGSDLRRTFPRPFENLYVGP